MKDRLSGIVLPEIAFRDALVLDVVDFLVGRAAQLAKPSGEIHRSDVTDQPERKERDPREDWVPRRRITITLKNVSFTEAVRRITEEAGLIYEITDFDLVIKTKDGKVLNRDAGKGAISSDRGNAR